jgi:hypothetical protein
MSTFTKCRVCTLPLPPGPQRAIGVCIACVANTQFAAPNMPQPRYGNGRHQAQSEPELE